MSLQEQFDLAVNIVQSLPKSGPIQPSNDTRLKFYGYYKQATEGKCNKPQPSFINFVERSKWGAWNQLENMEKDDAMKFYAEELKKTIEASPAEGTEASLQEKIDRFLKM